MQHNVFDHYDGVVNHETDGRGESAQRHKVEALSDQPQRKHGDGNGDGNDHAGDQRGAPVA